MIHAGIQEPHEKKHKRRKTERDTWTDQPRFHTQNPIGPPLIPLPDPFLTARLDSPSLYPHTRINPSIRRISKRLQPESIGRPGDDGGLTDEYPVRRERAGAEGEGGVDLVYVLVNTPGGRTGCQVRGGGDGGCSLRRAGRCGVEDDGERARADLEDRRQRHLYVLIRVGGAVVR